MAVTLTNVENPLNTNRYVFKAINNLVDRTTALIVPINASGQGSGETILFNPNGVQRYIEFDFVIRDDGVDASSGDHVSTVITIGEQYDYIKNTLLDGKFGTKFTLVVDSLISISGLVVECTISPTFENPNHYVGKMRVQEGVNLL